MDGPDKPVSHYTRMGRLARYNPTSVLNPFISGEENEVCDYGPGEFVL
jgi:hypothetical protein